MPRSTRPHLVLAAAALLALAGCAGIETYDTNAAVDSRPECASQPNRPDEPVAPWCERATGLVLGTEPKSDSIDLSGKGKKADGDDRDRR